MDAVFKALNDPTRRRILDALRQEDGQSLTALVEAAGLSRFAVMKHMKVLEAASLVVIRPAGRFRYHYLNALPLQELVDRWIEPLTRQPHARAVLNAKAGLEGHKTMTNPHPDAAASEKPAYVLETFIRTTPAELWQALTDGAFTADYYFGTRLESTLEPGAPYRYLAADGSTMLSGEIISIEPERRLEMTFLPAWGGEGAETTRNVYEIEPLGEVCKLTILHFGASAIGQGVAEGWSKIAAGLKTLLETGEALAIA